MKKYLSDNIKWIILSTIIICISYLPLCVSSNLHFDSERMLVHPEAVYEEFQRFGRLVMLFFTRDLLKGYYHPVFHGLIFLLFQIVSVQLIAYNVDRFLSSTSEGVTKTTDKFSLFLGTVLYGTSPIWAFSVYFQHQESILSIGMFFSTVSACLIARIFLQEGRDVTPVQRVIMYACATFLLLMDLYIYQALITHYLAVIFLFLFVYAWKCGKQSGKFIVSILLHIICVMGLYLISKHFLVPIQDDYLGSMILWKSQPVGECLKGIAIEIGKTVLMIHSGHFSAYVFGLVWLLAIFLKQRRKAERHPVNGWAIIAGLGVISIPFAMSVFLGDRPVIRMLVALPVVAAFLIVICQNILGIDRKLFFFLGICFITIQVLLVLRLTYTDHLRNEQDMQITQDILAELEEIDTEEKPIIFIGGLPYQDASFLTEKTDVFGRSFYEWIYTPEIPDSATPSAVRILEAVGGCRLNSSYNGEQVANAIQSSADMPAYPAEGYIRETDESVVICLSK